jgi:uncharacterized protein
MMFDWTIVYIAAVFALAGVVKGIVGLGLPTIAMGLLAVVMTPLQAAAILVVPSFLTNVWQMVSGPALMPVARRIWPMLLGSCIGTWAGAGLMTGAYARYGGALLGIALALYALTGLRSIRFSVDERREPWLGAAIGGATGLITAATGVFAIPSVPYLQAIGLEKEELVQALGLTFTVSTIALSVNLAFAGALKIGVAAPTLTALVMAGLGVWIGQILRLRLSPELFRRCFFFGLLLLGLYLIGEALI